MQPELIADFACECGENPLWHPFEKRVYWVDIPTGRLFRFDPKTEHSEVCYRGEEALGGFTVQADGALLLFLARGAVKRWQAGALSTVVEDIPDERETRFNDVIADPAGRVFCGTMPTADRPGRLYRLDVDGTLTMVLDGILCSNGCGFTPDRKRMYYTDSGKGEIYLFDYDVTTGALFNQRLFFQLPKEKGCPDGMTVDAEGFVWSAIWDGWRVIRYAPDGTIDREIRMPVQRPSSCMFGGPELKTLFVTSACVELGWDALREGPLAGALFALDCEVPGLAEPLFGAE